MNLSSKQIRHLRGLAHALKPIVIIGQQGLGDGVLREIEQGLLSHELVKIRINAEDREARIEIISIICNKLNCGFVQRIGHIATFYRPNPNQKRIQV